MTRPTSCCCCCDLCDEIRRAKPAAAAYACAIFRRRPVVFAQMVGAHFFVFFSPPMFVRRNKNKNGFFFWSRFFSSTPRTVTSVGVYARPSTAYLRADGRSASLKRGPDRAATVVRVVVTPITRRRYRRDLWRGVPSSSAVAASRRRRRSLRPNPLLSASVAAAASALEILKSHKLHVNKRLIRTGTGCAHRVTTAAFLFSL